MHWHVRVGKCPHRVSFFHKITKAFNQESSWMEKRHCPPKQRKRSLTAQTLLLSRARGFRSAASARLKIWDPPLNICPFLFLVHSRGSQSIIQRKVTQAPIQRLSKLGKCDSCLNYLLASMSELSLSSPWDPIYHVHMNMVGFIITASAHHYLSTGFTFFSSRRGGPSPSLEGVCLEVLA